MSLVSCAGTTRRLDAARIASIRDSAAESLRCAPDEITVTVERQCESSAECVTYRAQCPRALDEITYGFAPRTLRVVSTTFSMGQCFEGATYCAGAWRCNNGAGEPVCDKSEIDQQPCP